MAAGVPLGVLGALARDPSSWLSLQIGAAAGGLLLLLAVLVAGRFCGPETERGHLGRAAMLGFAALPAAGAAWLGLLPGAAWSFGALVLLVALFLFLATRASGPAGGALSQLATLAGVLALGAAASVAAAGLLAAFTPHPFAAPDAEKQAEYALAIDASVALGPEPACDEWTVASSREIGVGAQPSLSEDGALVWFDAVAPDGRRQIYRVPRAGGEPLCWSCGEPGNNRRPRVSPNGISLVFESDRHATSLQPTNWDAFLVSVRGSEPKSSRRLTFDPGPDTFGALDPGSRLLVWSSGSGGRFAVASAALRSGHGGLLLGSPSRLVDGGAAWVAPLAWSPDARTLVVLRGDPAGRQQGYALDPASGREIELSAPGAALVDASFSRDGSLLAVATTRPAAASAAMPASFGFLVARLGALDPREDTRLRGSGVRIGAPWSDELAPLSLGELAEWGHPTGIALEPDGSALVLGQRRTTEAGTQERLLHVELGCARKP